MAKKKMTAKQIKYFGTAHQKAALKAKRSAAARGKTKKTTTKKKTTAKKKTSSGITTGQAVGIGVGSAALGAAGGFVAGNLAHDATTNLLNNLAGSNNQLLAGIAGLLGGKAAAANVAPVPNQSLAGLPGVNAATTGAAVAAATKKVSDADASYQAYLAAIAAGQPVMTTVNGGIISTNQGGMRTAADVAFDNQYT